jgi:hypothetical protein
MRSRGSSGERDVDNTKARVGRTHSHGDHSPDNGKADQFTATGLLHMTLFSPKLFL